MDPHRSELEVADMPKEPPKEQAGNSTPKSKRMAGSADGGRNLFKEYFDKMYAEVAREPLPDELQKLLEELDAPRSGTPQGKGQGDA